MSEAEGMSSGYLELLLIWLSVVGVVPSYLFLQGVSVGMSRLPG